MSSSLRQDPSILQVLFFASRKFSELRQLLLPPTHPTCLIASVFYLSVLVLESARRSVALSLFSQGARRAAPRRVGAQNLSSPLSRLF
jgi:hypothetical protein